MTVTCKYFCEAMGTTLTTGYAMLRRRGINPAVRGVRPLQFDKKVIDKLINFLTIENKPKKPDEMNRADIYRYFGKTRFIMDRFIAMPGFPVPHREIVRVNMADPITVWKMHDILGFDLQALDYSSKQETKKVRKNAAGGNLIKYSPAQMLMFGFSRGDYAPVPSIASVAKNHRRPGKSTVVHLTLTDDYTPPRTYVQGSHSPQEYRVSL